MELEFGKVESTTAAPALVPTEALTTTTQDIYALEKLTPQEQDVIHQFVEKIDVTNTDAVLLYGKPAQQKIAEFSDINISKVKTKDSGEAGALLGDLVNNIEKFNIDTDESKGFFGKLFDKGKNHIDQLIARYSTVENNINKIVLTLEKHYANMLKDIKMYDVMYQTNLEYLKNLTLYIVAGKEKLKQLYAIDIPAMKEAAANSNDDAELQKYNDFVGSVNRFEKKIHDLELSRQIALQMGPQVRLLQNSDAQLADKIQSSIVNSIPLWKSQMVIALGLERTKSALEVQRKVTDMTNNMLQKNSELLKTATINVAKESERGIISMETIRKTNQDLIDTIYGVLEIQKTGHEQRVEAEHELVQIEEKFKQALLQAH